MVNFLFAKGQEVNVGLHFSPTVSVPLLEKQSIYDPSIKVQRANINASGGANLNFRFGKVCFETGGTISSKSIVFKLKLDEYSYNNLNNSSSISSKNNIRGTGYSLSVPAQLGYLINHHEANTTYDVFALAGASYELYTAGGYSSESATTNSNGTISNVNNKAPQAGQQTSWVNVIAGFKINAILRRVGLVEYGMRYHYPLGNAGKYQVETILSNGIYGSVFAGEFYPRLSYVDFHITYYFLNFKGGEGVKHYKYP